MAPRPLSAADHPAFLTLNNAAVPHVNHLDQADLDRLLALGARGLVAGDEGRPVAVALTFDQQCRGYASANYQWFLARFERFTYLDRIIVAPALRSRGCGRMLYAAVFRQAEAARSTVVCCEVNERPPNPASLAFHLGLGFAEAGRQTTEGGAKSVVLLTRAP